MQLQFIGATGTVTGSKTLLRADGKTILIDCGLFQGLKVLRLRNWRDLPVPPKEIDAVILTHAHIDHSGYLPVLVKNGFRGKIFTTEGTAALCKILLPDAGYLQEEDANFLNRHKLSKHEPALPLYTEADAVKSLEFFHTVAWQRKTAITKNLTFEFFPAGHIVGAAMVRIQGPGQSITFSGDLGRPQNLIMPPPHALPETDTLIVESTYGNRKHPCEDPMDTLKSYIEKTYKRGGILLIPSFAVGRAQEILFVIHKLKSQKKIPPLPVYLNSPMSVEATRIYCDFREDHRMTTEECRAICSTAEFVATAEDSKRLNSRTDPAIIISASGMATGGRVLHHLKKLAPDSKNLILFVGYQAAGTRGEALLHGAEQIKIHGQHIPVRAEVACLDSLSAHADGDEILSWLRSAPRAPRKTFIVHGESLAADTLRQRINEELKWSCAVPDYLETVDL